MKNGKRKYQRTCCSYQAQQHCRLSLRQGGTLLVILFTNEIAKQAEIEIGKRVDLLFDEAELTIVPDDAGQFIVRKQKSGNITYPHVVVPVGPGKPFSCSFSGSILCEHEVDEHTLVLRLPQGVELTNNGNQVE